MLDRQLKERKRDRRRVGRAWNVCAQSVSVRVLCHHWDCFTFSVAKLLTRVLNLAKPNTNNLWIPITKSISSSNMIIYIYIFFFFFLYGEIRFLVFLFLPFLAIARFVYYLEFNCGVRLQSIHHSGSALFFIAYECGVAFVCVRVCLWAPTMSISSIHRFVMSLKNLNASRPLQNC